MGKAEVRVVIVPRAVTVLLLLLLSAAMASLIFLLSGKAAVHDRLTLAELISLIRRYDAGTMSSDAVLATIAPAIADVLLFLPWGALAFLALYGEGHRARTYLLTLALGVAFALGLVAWQNRLPTRVTNWYDAAWNCAGCLAGAMAGDVRKRIRVRFE